MLTFESCYCGSGASLEACCGGIISGRRKARTAEQLMRSRYTAYVLGDDQYLVRTTLPESRTSPLEASILQTMQQIEWLRLHVISFSRGGVNDESGTVEFVAEYVSPSGPGRHHEESLFRKVGGTWFYVGELA
ncbi:MAG: hypothetical protein JXR25_13395 [Pontiellaceae bacterium]|nr:hypothetical protein [Pontiellaceae bacterium]MBN2785810.1 hypothetical protein [Pontiellaceae bacterium]